MDELVLQLSVWKNALKKESLLYSFPAAVTIWVSYMERQQDSVFIAKLSKGLYHDLMKEIKTFAEVNDKIILARIADEHHLITFGTSESISSETCIVV